MKTSFECVLAPLPRSVRWFICEIIGHYSDNRTRGFSTCYRCEATLSSPLR